MDLAPLFGLRLRTPRLELRLPRSEELDALREVALGGIHPPEFMPFTIAWTDDPELAEFRAYHEMRRRDWRVEEWHLELGVFLEGEPVGIQAVESRDFPATLTVGTGSWLGRRFQRRGVGTEMRTAALELAFRVSALSWRAQAPSTGTWRRCGSPKSSATGRSVAARSRRAASSCTTRTSRYDERTGGRRSPS